MPSTLIFKIIRVHREMKELKRQSLIVFQIILQDQFYKTTFLFYFFAALGKNTQNAVVFTINYCIFDIYLNKWALITAIFKQ